MKCPECKTEISENEQTCPHCGATIEKKPIKSSRRNLWIGIAAAIVALCCIVTVIGAVAGILIYQLSPTSCTILYANTDWETLDYYSSIVNSIETVNIDGSEHNQVAYNREGLILPISPFRGDLVAPDGNWLGFYELDDSYEGKLVLTSFDGKTQILSDKSAFMEDDIVFLNAFSPNGTYFAYNSMDEDDEELTLHVIDDKGTEILSQDDLILVSFFPDSKRILVLEYEPPLSSVEMLDLAWLDVKSGEMTSFFELENEDVLYSLLLGRSISPDGKKVYLCTEEELVAIDIEAQTSTAICDVQDPYMSIPFILNDLLIVYSEEGLIIVPLDTEESTQIEAELPVDEFAASLGWKMVDVSKKGAQVAYTAWDSEDYDKVMLYVVDADGTNRHRISDDDYCASFAFSPDGKKIAYLVVQDDDEPGKLYISDVDGSNQQRLDVDVWSFRFTSDSKRIVYSTVQDLDQGEPQSEIYSIGVDGQDRQLVREEEEGLISILDLRPNSLFAIP